MIGRATILERIAAQCRDRFDDAPGYLSRDALVLVARDHPGTVAAIDVPADAAANLAYASRFVAALRARGDHTAFVIDEASDGLYQITLSSWQAMVRTTRLHFDFTDDLLIVSDAGDVVFVLFHHEDLEVYAWDGDAQRWLDAITA